MCPTNTFSHTCLGEFIVVSVGHFSVQKAINVNNHIDKNEKLYGYDAGKKSMKSSVSSRYEVEENFPREDIQTGSGGTVCNLRETGQDDHKFEVSLRHTARACPKDEKGQSV